MRGSDSDPCPRRWLPGASLGEEFGCLGTTVHQQPSSTSPSLLFTLLFCPVIVFSEALSANTLSGR